MPRKPSYPGPYLIEFIYGVTINNQLINHTHAINCKPVGAPVPGSAATSILLSTGGGGTKALDAAVNQYWGFVRMIIPTATVLPTASFFRVEDGSYEKVFITAVPLTVVTTGGGNAQPAREDTLTFRSGLGSYMQINIQEVGQITEAQLALIPSPTGDNYQRLANYVLSADGILTCRDRTFPIGAMRRSNTQNEVIYKKRWRNS